MLDRTDVLEQLPTVWDESMQCRDVSVVAFTPIALTCFWHTGWVADVWKESYEEARQHPGTSAFGIAESEKELVSLLQRQVDGREQEVRKDLMSGNHHHRRTVQSLFTNKGEARTSPTNSHLILMHKTLDLILLPRAYERSGGQDRRLTPQHHLPMWNVKGPLAAYIESLHSWPTTLTNFLNSLKTMRGDGDLSGCVDGVARENGSFGSGGKRAIYDLMKAAKDINVRAKIAFVESNFISAALGLVACTLEPCPGKSLADQLVEMTGIENEELTKLSDYELLRPLYIAAAISPICLLKGSHITNNHIRIALYECTECLRLPNLANDDRRYRLEAELVEMLIDMALYGHNAYEKGMDRLLKTWSAEVIGVHDFTSKYQVRLSAWTSKQVQKENPVTMKVSSILMDIAVRGRFAVHVPLTAGWVGKIMLDLLHSRVVEDGECREDGLFSEEVDELMNEDEGERTVPVGELDEAEDSGAEKESADLDTGASVENLIEGHDIHEGRRKRKAVDLNELNLVGSGGEGKMRSKKKQKRQTISAKARKASVASEENESSERPVRNKYLRKAPANDMNLLFEDKNAFTIFVPRRRGAGHEGNCKQIDEYEAREFSVNQWKSMGEENEELQHVLDNCTKPGESEFCQFVKEFWYEDWVGLDERTRREIFAESCVAVHEAPIGSVSGVTHWGSPHLEELVDMEDSLEGQDQSIPIKKQFTERLCQSTVNEFIAGRSNVRVNLFLSIPVLPNGTGQLPTHDVNDGNYFMYRDNRRFSWSTPPSSDPLVWALLGTESATSMVHTDASGLGTYVECLIGSKLWFIARAGWEDVPDVREGWDVQKLRFQCVVLKPGSRLYMRPTQPHFVLTLEDTLAIGTHFYSSLTYSNTLRGLAIEHYAGKVVTNAEHLTSPLLLFKLLDAHVRMWRDSGVGGLSRRSPAASELAALLLCIEYMDELDPEVPPERFRERWQASKEFEYDHAHAKLVAKELYGIVRDSQDAVLIRIFEAQEEVFENFLRSLNASTSRKDQHLRIEPRQVFKTYFRGRVKEVS